MPSEIGGLTFWETSHDLTLDMATVGFDSVDYDDQPACPCLED